MKFHSGEYLEGRRCLRARARSPRPLSSVRVLLREGSISQRRGKSSSRNANFPSQRVGAHGDCSLHFQKIRLPASNEKGRLFLEMHAVPKKSNRLCLSHLCQPQCIPSSFVFSFSLLLLSCPSLFQRGFAVFASRKTRRSTERQKEGWSRESRGKSECDELFLPQLLLPPLSATQEKK